MNIKTINIKKFSILGMLLAIVSSFFISTNTVSAASNLNMEKTSYVYTGISSITGNNVNDNIWKLKMDGKYVFCIESGIYTDAGGGYIPDNFTSAKKDLLSKIAYYGYTNTGKTDYDYSVTQVMIWETLGDKYISSNITNYHARKAEIMNLVNQHDLLPTWHNQELVVESGKSITITDSNKVINKMTLTNNPTGTSIAKSGNKLTITADKNSKSGTISYQKIPNKEVGASIVYKKPDKQTLVEFHLENNVNANIKLKVIQFGDLQIQKIDETTGNPLPNTTLKFEYNGITKEITTDKNGIAKIDHIAEGTLIKVTEVKSAHGYFNKGEIRNITIEANKTIEVKFNNKPQQGTLNLTKTGEKAVDLKITDSIYGKQHQFKFDYRPLAGVTFEIRAIEDIVVGDVVRFKANDIVATVTTNEQGKIDSPRLFLGKYEVAEKSAPNGFLINKAKMTFELSYQDQYIELVSASLSAENEFQKLKLVLHKNEEIIIDWKDNKPTLDIIKANNKVFGIFINEDLVISDTLTLPKDSLLDFGTVTKGELIFDDLQYPEGKYYFKELDSGSNHELDENKYEFEFKSKDHKSFQEIHIFDTYKENSIEIIKNRLHFNKLQFKKSNEQAMLSENEGYSYNYNGNAKGAVFTLHDENMKVIQTITINNDSLGIIDNIPVGTFYLKEKTPSDSAHILSEKLYKLESTKDGVKVTEDDKLVAEQKSNDPITILFELKNDIIKGSVELTKYDIETKQLLSNTKVQILDENMKVVIVGKTDAKGKFGYSSLPKGIYYFQELTPPNGYRLDSKLIKFEIKDNNEVVHSTMGNIKISSSLPQTGDTTLRLVFITSSILIISGMTLLLITSKSKKKTT